MFWSHHHPQADVKLPLVDEQGRLDVLLEHKNIRFDVRVDQARLLLLGACRWRWIVACVVKRCGRLFDRCGCDTLNLDALFDVFRGVTLGCSG